MLSETPSNSRDTFLPEKDAIYYLKPVTIQVEDHLFKIPQYQLTQHSPIFRDMFSFPQDNGTPAEGSSDRCPIKLDVSKTDFCYLLEVLFPLEIPPPQTLSKSGWVSVLRLSNMWEMEKIRELAITKLTAIGMVPIEKIVLAKEYHVPQWLRSGYQELVDRADMLTTKEAKEISFESATGIFQIRESRYRGNYSSSTFTVEKVFETELAEEERWHTDHFTML